MPNSDFHLDFGDFDTKALLDSNILNIILPGVSMYDSNGSHYVGRWML